MTAFAEHPRCADLGAVVRTLCLNAADEKSTRLGDGLAEVLSEHGLGEADGALGEGNELTDPLLRVAARPVARPEAGDDAGAETTGEPADDAADEAADDEAPEDLEGEAATKPLPRRSLAKTAAVAGEVVPAPLGAIA